MYLTPVNFERIGMYCAKEEVAAMQAAIDGLKTILGGVCDDKVKFFDLSHALTDRCFSEPAYANEHLTQEGRDTIAAALGDVI